MADVINSAVGSLSALVPEMWSAAFTQNLNDNLVFNSIVRRDYEGEISSLGDTVRIPTIAAFNASQLLEGATGQASVITASTSSLVVNNRAYVDFKITDQAQLQSVSFMDKLEQEATQALLRYIQEAIVSAIAPSASNPDHTIAYDNGTVLADSDLLEALDLERVANWPSQGLFLVTGGGQYNDLINIQKFYDKDSNAGDAPSISGAVVAPVYGHAASWTTAVGTTTYLFHDSFMQMAIQKDLNISVTDLAPLGERGYRVNCDVLFGVAQLHSDRVISIS
jgi:hypothetical protein